MAGFVLLAGLAAVDIGVLAAARAATQAAADLAALAALTPEPTTTAGPEARAAELAAANGAELVACDCSAIEAVVTVRRRQRLVPAALVVRLTSRARAVLGQPPGAVRATVRGGGFSGRCMGIWRGVPTIRPVAARRADLRANASAATAAVLFGGSVVAVRVAVRDIPPISLAVLRIGWSCSWGCWAGRRRSSSGPGPCPA
jgi:hypothetical protein